MLGLQMSREPKSSNQLNGKKLPVNSISHTSKVFLFVAVKMGEISQAKGCERWSPLCGVAATTAKKSKINKSLIHLSLRWAFFPPFSSKYDFMLKVSLFNKPLHASDISPFISGGLRESRWPRVQRLNNRKRAGYVNTSADTDLSKGAQGLHKGLRTEDVTSDRAAESMQTFSRSSGANGGWGRSRSSFVVGQLAISLMSLSAAEASIIHLTSGREQGVRLPGSGISQGKRWLPGSFRIPSFYISS